MKSHWIQVMIIGITIFALAGCNVLQNSSGQSEAGNPLPPPDMGEGAQEFSGDFGDSQFGADAKWPDYIPAEIPVLPGKIETVMVAPGSHIRLFYSKVSEKDIERYLATLEKEGFNLEYRIYIQEGFLDNSEEKRKRGEYDAVDITKGVFHMNLSHGAGPATYDIYTTGFQNAVEEAVAVAWPANLDGLLPQPDRCELVTITPNGQDGYHVTCKPEDDTVYQDYRTLLDSHGFQVFSQL